MLLSSKSRVEDLRVSDAKEIKYHRISKEEMWRVQVIKEMQQMKSGENEIATGWLMEEMGEACTS